MKIDIYIITLVGYDPPVQLLFHSVTEALAMTRSHFSERAVIETTEVEDSNPPMWSVIARGKNNKPEQLAWITQF